MKEINCNIIRDLLPLYEDGVVSEDTAQLVREHLEGCPACREEYERMHAPTPVPPDRDISLIQHMEREINKKSVLRFFCGVGVLAVLACLFCLWYTWPVPYEDLIPEGAECQEITLIAHMRDDDCYIQYEETLTSKDPAFGQLLSLVDGKSYRRPLSDLLPNWLESDGDETRRNFEWHLNFHYDVPQEDGTVSRASIWLEHYWKGTMSFAINDDHQSNSYTYTVVATDDQAEWADDVMDVIRQLPSVSEVSLFS